jgi:hypothetical protein
LHMVYNTMCPSSGYLQSEFTKRKDRNM